MRRVIIRVIFSHGIVVAGSQPAAPGVEELRHFSGGIQPTNCHSHPSPGKEWSHRPGIGWEVPGSDPTDIPFLIGENEVEHDEVTFSRAWRMSWIFRAVRMASSPREGRGFQKEPSAG